jgi:hypothetical protein
MEKLIERAEPILATANATIVMFMLITNRNSEIEKSKYQADLDDDIRPP